MSVVTVEKVSYRTINDKFLPGPIKIWFMQSHWFRDGAMGEKPDRENLSDTHILLGSIGGYDEGRAGFDEIWMDLQCESWSPNGEARDFLRRLGLKHTSMSVGDCIELENGEVWVCADFGFELVR